MMLAPPGTAELRGRSTTLMRFGATIRASMTATTAGMAKKLPEWTGTVAALTLGKARIARAMMEPGQGAQRGVWGSWQGSPSKLVLEGGHSDGCVLHFMGAPLDMKRLAGC